MNLGTKKMAGVTILIYSGKRLFTKTKNGKKFLIFIYTIINVKSLVFRKELPATTEIHSPIMINTTTIANV
jgi:hypothetical protein